MEEEKQISKKELARRKKLSALAKKRNEKRRREGHKKYLEKVKAEAAARRKEKEKEKKRLKREKQKEREKAKRALNKGGRPRKRGPKKKYRPRKKPTPPQSRKLPPFTFKIISCKNGKQNKFIGRYRTSEEAYEAFNDLKMEDRNIIFPKSIMTYGDRIENSIDEYVLIEKSDKDVSVLRNEYGKLVEHRTNISGWTILDKYRYKKEEDFWVWGYDNRSERKTFLWIYRNILLDGIESRLDYKRVLIYKNKIVFKDDNGYMDIVFCKDEADAVKFYNMLEEWTRRDKIKQVLFIGDFSTLSPRRKALEDEMMELTGWTRKRVQMKATTYYLK